MGCVKLLKGLDISCFTDGANRYYQNLILLNKKDVDEHRIISNESEHKITFSLKPELSGFLFKGNEAATIFDADFSKSTKKGIPFYNHKVQVPISGSSEYVKTLLIQLDSADVFAAVRFRNGDIDIYGFENGLVSGDYNYEPQGELGGAIIDFSSRYSEYKPPYRYFANGNESENYDNLFEGIGRILGGDFNNDFNNDFDNLQV